MGMKEVVNDVRAFHEATDTPILAEPDVPARDRVKLRKDLIDEEHEELGKAIEADCLPDIADGIADLIYVLVGTALEYGIPLDKVWEEVQAANMRKVDPATGKVRRREDGKVLKPAGWYGPDILKALGWGEKEQASV